MDKYWPEQEVFLAGQRSLGRKVPSKKLLAYLEKFQRDELTTGTVDRPASFTVQREKLVDAMRKKFPEHGYRQIIRGNKMDVDVQNFWELVFAMHYVTRDIEIINNIGFDKLEFAPGISTTRKIPHAELKVVDTLLRQAIAPATKAVETKQRVSIIAGDKGEVYARLADGTKYWVSTLRADNDPYRFLDYLLKHPDTLLTGSVIRAETKVDAKYGMTELVRQCGFTKELLPLKPIFFPETTKTKIHFRQTAELNSEEIVLLARRDARRTKPQLAENAAL